MTKKERYEGDKKILMPLMFDSFRWSNALSNRVNNLWLFYRQRWDLWFELARWLSLVVFWLEVCGYSDLALAVSNSSCTLRLYGGDLEKWRKSSADWMIINSLMLYVSGPWFKVKLYRWWHGSICISLIVWQFSLPLNRRLSEKLYNLVDS